MSIIMVTGLPGSGKSFFASRLAESVGAEYISSDRIRKKIFDARTYSEQEKSTVYHEMLRLMSEAGRNEKDVVLDATFYKTFIRNLFLNRAKELSLKVYIIEMTAPFSLIQKRLSGKREDSEAGLQVYEQIRQETEPVTEKHLVLESEENNIDLLISKSLEYIHEQEPG